MRRHRGTARRDNGDKRRFRIVAGVSHNATGLYKTYNWSEAGKVLRQTWLLLGANNAHKSDHVLVTTPSAARTYHVRTNPIPSRRFMRHPLAISALLVRRLLPPETGRLAGSRHTLGEI